jgi:hypothetical protein
MYNGIGSDVGSDVEILEGVGSLITLKAYLRYEICLASFHCVRIVHSLKRKVGRLIGREDKIRNRTEKSSTMRLTIFGSLPC